MANANPLHAFLGEDSQGDHCIYIGRLDDNGDFTGDYLTPLELSTIIDSLNGREGWAEADAPAEPDHDDSVRCCPDCERPNQFGELCAECAREQGVQRG